MSSSRPFFCDLCSKVFTRNENLERHKRSKHHGDTHRPFECFRCQSRFSRKDVCKRHAERCRGRRDEAQTQSEGLEVVSYPPAQTLFDEGNPSLTVAVESLSPEQGGTSLDQVEEYEPDDPWTQSVLLRPPSMSGAAQRRGNVHISAYFKYFHPSFPLLHRPTVVDQSPDLLVNIMIAIGSLYTARTLSEQDASTCIAWSQNLWEAGQRELDRLSDIPWQDLQRTWVIQAWLLHIVYGAFMGDATQYQKAKALLRTLIDAVQDLGLLKQAVVSTESQSWIKAVAEEAPENDPARLESHWMMYSNEEAMKLCMHTVLFLDFQILYPCNIRSLVSALDLGWELPFSSTLWESDSAATWYEALQKDARVSVLLEPNEELCFPGPTTQSLALAMQSLMSDTPNPDIIAALEASPISIIFLLSSLDSLVRDFTRSYYQLPPTLSDPSAFHILTQAQNRQISAVLRHVSKMRPQADDGSQGSIWTGIERMALAVKISLYKPDDLLIGGIVDSSVVAGLATATHLTLGRYTGSRRSLQSLLQHNSGDDGVLFILEETVDTLSSIFGHNGQDALYEAPWVTVATHRILLAGWRSLRWAAPEMRKRAEQQVKRFDTPSIIFNAIAGAVVDRGELCGQGDGFSPTPIASETCFTKGIQRFWTGRCVWAIGSSMVPVLNEIISAGL